jgi:glycosyltransferase involved in cell wall biosynthesis
LQTPGSASGPAPLIGRASAIARGWTIVRLHVPSGSAGPVHLTLRMTVAGRLLDMPLRSDQARPAYLPDAPESLELHGIDSEDGVPACRIGIRASSHAEVALRALLAGLRAPRPLLRALYHGTWRSTLFGGGSTSQQDYADWIARYDAITPGRAAKLRASLADLGNPPRFSVLVPVYNTDERHLRAMIESVQAQIYPHWELCIADDASCASHVLATLRTYASADSRVRVAFRPRNGNISAASNTALELATGDFCALLDHDDLLAAHALLMMARAIGEHPDADLLYSDEDKLDRHEWRNDPYFKPDFNPELLHGQNVISHLGVYRTSMLRRLGGFRGAFDGSQDYDLALRVAAATKAPIVHVPHVLYHWRLFRGAGTFSSTRRDQAARAARRAIREQLAGQGETVEVMAGVAGYHRVLRQPPSTWPRVSVILPSGDHVALLRACIDGLLHGTDYPDLEVIVVDHDRVGPATLKYLAALAGSGVRVVRHAGAFNAAAMNNAAARAASGAVLLFLDNAVAMIAAGWLKEMVTQAIRPGVGAVGARLLYPDGTVQHAGVVLGLGGIAGAVHARAPRRSLGYFGRLGLTQEVSCVSGACMAVPAGVFASVGGFDAENLPVALNDVDLCLRIRAAGLRIIWTPHAELYRWKSKSRPRDPDPAQIDRYRTEVAYLLRRWPGRLANDPFFSPNLSLNGPEPVPAFPPRIARAWVWPAH